MQKLNDVTNEHLKFKMRKMKDWMTPLFYTFTYNVKESSRISDRPVKNGALL